ncbi:hypothetical protein EVAR_37955_1 [Eumeta japonica]|uniref:Uncharacterized protein n=1 Tax=Eumeta variegata TaxID=151549 RepID=A0A4C1XE09_EUMVA|nr:hypothetical protein EVAR_37955_1 [Eumeta japonica]
MSATWSASDARPLLLIGQDNWELITGSDVRRKIREQMGDGSPLKEDDPRFPDNYNGARKRLTNIENKMDRDLAFAAAYTAQIEKLIENGYARRLENRAQVRDCFSHISPLQTNKPNKIRVVFDAAARFEGKSLNDYLLSGPDLLNSLTGILFRFRIGSVAFTGDIRDMFLRVRVCAPDQRAQLFLWRSRQRAPCVRDDFADFGASSSPTSAIYVLNKMRKHTQCRKPQINKRRHHSARAGLRYPGWATNAPELKESLSAESSAEAATVSLHKTKTERALGLIWEPECDSLGFDVTFKKLA